MRSAAGEPQAPGGEVTAPDSFDRSDSLGPAGRIAAHQHRFRTKRQLLAYSGFAVETHDSGEYRWVRGNRWSEQQNSMVFDRENMVDQCAVLPRIRTSNLIGLS
jgi:hypothetical protein